MSLPERRRIPDWAARERARDLAWIQENLHIFWPAAQHAYAEQGRGAIVVDTASRPTGEGNPFLYLPETEVEKLPDSDSLRMVRDYDPTWEFVAMLLKSQERTSTYRVGVPSQKKP